MKVRCNKSDSTELCKTCPHNGDHEEVIYEGVTVTHRIAHVCSEGGRVRCIISK